MANQYHGLLPVADPLGRHPSRGNGPISRHLHLLSKARDKSDSQAETTDGAEQLRTRDARRADRTAISKMSERQRHFPQRCCQDTLRTLAALACSWRGSVSRFGVLATA